MNASEMPNVVRVISAGEASGVDRADEVMVRSYPELADTVFFLIVEAAQRSRCWWPADKPVESVVVYEGGGVAEGGERVTGEELP